MNQAEDIQFQETSSLEQLTQGGQFRPVLDFDLGVKRAKCVARVIHAGRVKGTGFLLPGNWFLTNNHVLPDQAAVADPLTTAEFNFQIGEDGLVSAPATFHFEPASFNTSLAHGGDDWTLVRLRPGIKGEAVQEFGSISLSESDSNAGDAIHIIQHPNGQPKVFASGSVTHAHIDRLLYNVDTLPGSSGSPVFNSEWQVIALHHAAVGNDPDTGKPRPLNRGIRISAVIDGLKARGLWPLSRPQRVIAREFGPMSPASDWYVPREQDEEILEFFLGHGVSASLRGGSRMGKSSMAARLGSVLEMERWRVLRLNLRDDFVDENFATGHAFLSRLAARVLVLLKASPAALRIFEVEKAGTAFRDFIDEVHAEKKDGRLLIVFDQADHLATKPGCSVVVGGLRSCHSRQCELGNQSWVHFLLIHTLTPRQSGAAGSIFKVAETYAVSDFGPKELEHLIARYDLTGLGAEGLLQVLGGHPYLTRLALNAIVANHCTIEDVTAITSRLATLFRPHLQDVAQRMTPLACAGFQRLAGGNPLSSIEEFEALLLAGVVNDVPWRRAQLRCELYKTHLGEYLP